MVDFMLQLTNIVRVLQKHGMYYGDIHPGNLMINSEGNLVLTDFGYSFKLNMTNGTIQNKAGEGWGVGVHEYYLEIENNYTQPEVRL